MMNIQELREAYENTNTKITRQECQEICDKLNGIHATVTPNDLIRSIGEALANVTSEPALNVFLYARTMQTVIRAVFPDDADEILKLFEEDNDGK